MASFYIWFKIFCLISIFQYTLNKIDIKSKYKIDFDNRERSNTYPSPSPNDDMPNKDSEKPSNTIVYIIEVDGNSKVGNKGSILFVGQNYGYFQFESDISRKPYFINKIFDINNKTYNVNCGPWIINEDFSIFCEFEESIPKGQYTITFDDIKFNYSDIEIQLYSDIFQVAKVDYDMVDIYSEIQSINLTDNKEKYELNYYVKLYNNEHLFFVFYNNIVQANCNQKNNVLKCTITRNVLESNSFWNKIYLAYFNEEGELQILRFSSYIDVNYNSYNNEKTDIFVGITNLLTRNDIGTEGSITFETNVTEISNVDIWFASYLFENENEDKIPMSCRFLKGEKKPMLFICHLTDIEYRPNKTLYLKECTNELIINETIKYNFRIQPIKQNYTFTINSYKEPFIKKSIPEVLDFTKKDSYKIEFYTSNTFELTGVLLMKRKKI